MLLRYATKCVAVVTLVCFSITSFLSVPAHALNMPSPAITSPGAENAIIPSDIGRITDEKYFGSQQVVINIQDLHCHPEVQMNISKILDSLDRKYHLNNVFVEGGYGDINTSWLCNISDKTIKKEVLNFLVNQGKLTGTEYYSVTANRPSLLKGIEDEKLHKDNIARLGTLIEKKNEFEKHLAGLSTELENMKAQYFTAKNKRFEGIIEDYKKGDMDAVKYYTLLGKYVESIQQHPNEYHNITALNMQDYPTMVAYLDILRQSRHINYTKVSHDLQKLVATLKSRISYGEYAALLEKTNNFTDMDAVCVALSKISKVRAIAVTPALASFFAYTDKSHAINPMRLIDEERRLVADIRISLSENVGEFEVSFLAGFFQFYREYLLNKLSAEDYDYFLTKFDTFRTIWGKYTYKNHIIDEAQSFLMLNEYYAVNLERNNSFINHIMPTVLSLNKEPKANTEEQSAVIDDRAAIVTALNNGAHPIVIVTGGFHTEGLKKLLEEQKISYITIMPMVTKDAKRADVAYTEFAREQSKILSNSLALALAAQLSNPEQFKMLVDYAREKLKGQGFTPENRALIRDLFTQAGLTEVMSSNENEAIFTSNTGAQYVIHKNNETGLIEILDDTIKMAENVLMQSEKVSVDNLAAVLNIEKAVFQGYMGQLHGLYTVFVHVMIKAAREGIIQGGNNQVKPTIDEQFQGPETRVGGFSKEELAVLPWDVQQDIADGAIRDAEMMRDESISNTDVITGAEQWRVSLLMKSFRAADDSLMQIGRSVDSGRKNPGSRLLSIGGMAAALPAIATGAKTFVFTSGDALIMKGILIIALLAGTIYAVKKYTWLSLGGFILLGGAFSNQLLSKMGMTTDYSVSTGVIVGLVLWILVKHGVGLLPENRAELRKQLLLDGRTVSGVAAWLAFKEKVKLYGLMFFSGKHNQGQRDVPLALSILAWASLAATVIPSLLGMMAIPWALLSIAGAIITPHVIHGFVVGSNVGDVIGTPGNPTEADIRIGTFQDVEENGANLAASAEITPIWMVAADNATDKEKLAALKPLGINIVIPNANGSVGIENVMVNEHLSVYYGTYQGSLVYAIDTSRIDAENVSEVMGVAVPLLLNYVYGKGLKGDVPVPGMIDRFKEALTEQQLVRVRNRIKLGPVVRSYFPLGDMEKYLSIPVQSLYNEDEDQVTAYDGQQNLGRMSGFIRAELSLFILLQTLLMGKLPKWAGQSKKKQALGASKVKPITAHETTHERKDPRTVKHRENPPRKLMTKNEPILFMKMIQRQGFSRIAWNVSWREAWPVFKAVFSNKALDSYLAAHREELRPGARKYVRTVGMTSIVGAVAALLGAMYFMSPAIGFFAFTPLGGLAIGLIAGIFGVHWWNDRRALPNSPPLDLVMTATHVGNLAKSIKQAVTFNQQTGGVNAIVVQYIGLTSQKDLRPVMKVSVPNEEGTQVPVDVYVGMDEGVMVFSVNVLQADIFASKAVDRAIEAAMPQILATAFGMDKLSATTEMKDLIQEVYSEKQKARLGAHFKPIAVVYDLPMDGDGDKLQKDLLAVNVSNLPAISASALDRGVDYHVALEREIALHATESAMAASKIVVEVGSKDVLRIKKDSEEQLRKSVTVSNSVQNHQLMLNWKELAKTFGTNLDGIVQVIREGKMTLHLKYVADKGATADAVTTEVLTEYDHGFTSVNLDLRKLDTTEAKKVLEKLNNKVPIIGVWFPEGLQDMEGIARSFDWTIGSPLPGNAGVSPVLFANGVTKDKLLDAKKYPKNIGLLVLQAADIAEALEAGSDGYDKEHTTAVLKIVGRIIGKQEITTLEDARNFAYSVPVNDIPSLEQWVSMSSGKPVAEDSVFNELLTQLKGNTVLTSAFLIAIRERATLKELLQPGNKILEPVGISDEDKAKLLAAYENGTISRADEKLLGMAFVRFGQLDPIYRSALTNDIIDQVKLSGDSFEGMKREFLEIVSSRKPIDPAPLAAAIKQILNDLIDDSRIKEPLPDEKAGVNIQLLNDVLSAA